MVLGNWHSRERGSRSGRVGAAQLRRHDVDGDGRVRPGHEHLRPHLRDGRGGGGQGGRSPRRCRPPRPSPGRARPARAVAGPRQGVPPARHGGTVHRNHAHGMLRGCVRDPPNARDSRAARLDRAAESRADRARPRPDRASDRSRPAPHRAPPLPSALPFLLPLSSQRSRTSTRTRRTNACPSSARSRRTT